MEKIIDTPIIGEVEQSFLDYSLSVITDRAIPSAEDGLKPVARRILWDMFDKGYTHNKKVVKCAQPVGDTMGRFHPHGDSSIYGALVWLSQPWNMRYPLISFHGNNGSRDGDEPAAYRYTECKLSVMGEEMLKGIKKDTVDWQPAYTDEEDEPVYLPGLIPNLIVNGTSGIAVAMACSFAPHNLSETMDATIHLLNNPDCSIADLMKHLPGPDFPTGGLIINKDELAEAYATGRGRARIRGEYVIETKQGKDSIVFTSIPYKVSKEKLIVDIDKLCEDETLEGITAIRDESNHEGVRFVIELGKGVSAEPIIAKLFKMTDLETTYSFNQVALVDKKPLLLNLKQLIQIYIDHQKDVLIRETNFDLAKIKARINILEGLLIALEDIDNVIKLIKSSPSSAEAKTSLMAAYELNEAQAKAILDMKLSKLANLEQIELKTEKKDLLMKMEELKEILTNPNPKLESIFSTLKVAYGDPRRSKITQVAVSKEEKEIEFVEPEKCVVIMTESGLIKRVPSSSFRTQRRNGKGVKNADDIISCVIRTNTIDSLMVFTNKGQMYRLLVNDIPEGTNSSVGTSIRSLVPMQTDENPATIYSIYRDTEATYVVFVTKNGIIKKTALEEYMKTKKKSGLSAINLHEDDTLTSVSLIKDETLVLVTAQGLTIHFNSMDVAPTSRTAVGSKGIDLKPDDHVVAALPVRNKSDNLAIFMKNGLGKKMNLSDFPVQKRGGKGLLCTKISDSTGLVAGAALVSDEDNLLVAGTPSSICISATDIPLTGRPAIGNQIVKGSKISSVSKI
jgi:DNA gyrase subunit A